MNGSEWDLAEQGRRLASERDDLIAKGVDPSTLEVPLRPGGSGPTKVPRRVLEAVKNAMFEHGPDGHWDGAEEIARAALDALRDAQ